MREIVFAGEIVFDDEQQPKRRPARRRDDRDEDEVIERAAPQREDRQHERDGDRRQQDAQRSRQVLEEDVVGDRVGPLGPALCVVYEFLCDETVDREREDG